MMGRFFTILAWFLALSALFGPTVYELITGEPL